jgi:hypothetical protein
VSEEATRGRGMGDERRGDEVNVVGVDFEAGTTH